MRFNVSRETIFISMIMKTAIQEFIKNKKIKPVSEMSRMIGLLVPR